MQPLCLVLKALGFSSIKILNVVVAAEEYT